MQIADPEKDKKMALRAFMGKLERALKTKTGQAQHRTALKIHGQIRALAATHPGELERLSVAIDKLPRGKDPDWYRIAAKGVVEDLKLEHRVAERGYTPPGYLLDRQGRLRTDPDGEPVLAGGEKRTMQTVGQVLAEMGIG